MANITGAFANPANTDIWIEWSTSVDTANNTSTLTATLKIKKTTSYNTTKNGSVPYSLTIAGSVVKSGTIAIDFSGASVGTTKTICTYTNTYTHNSNGTLGSKTISGVVDLSANNPGRGIVPSSGTSYVTFSTIPRGCDLTSYTGSVNIGSTISVTIDRKSSSFTHTATISLSGSGTTASATFDAGTGSNTKTITIPTAWASVITGTSNSNCVLTVLTKNGSTTISTINVNFTTIIPSSSYSPTINTASVLAVNPSPISSNTTTYIKTKTIPRITVQASTKSGATLENIRIKASDGSYDNTLNLSTTSTVNYDLPTITDTTSRNYTLIVTDSRGFSTSATTSSISIQDYNPPNLSSFNAIRCNSNGTVNTGGTSIKVTCNYTYSSCNSLNSVTCNAKINSNTAVIVTSGVEKVLSGTLATTVSGIVYLTFGDIFTSTTYTKSIGTQVCPIDIAPNNGGIAIGGISQGDGYFDIYMPTKLNNTLTVSGTTNVIAGSGFPGTTASTDFNKIWKSGFYESNGGENAPFSAWNWLIHAGHTSNNSAGSYNYGMQIAAQNCTNNFAIRTTNNLGTGSWNTLYHTGNKPSAADVGAYYKYEVYNTSETYNRWDWTLNSNTTGYCKIPNGTIIQWGATSITPSAADTVTSQTITFPTSFPNACKFVIANPKSSVPNKLSTSCTIVNTSSFNLYMTRANTTATDYFWFAVGC